MATATQKPSAAPPPPPKTPEPAPAPRGLPRAIEATYRFLASLKLAVLSIATLAAVLAYGTFYERWHGTPAVQERIYQSPAFALLLATLGINIFCAASIRFPWKRRQVGFVITHVGLLVVLVGSFLSKQKAEEGQVGYLEGEEREVTLVQPDRAILRVRSLDPETGKPVADFEMPFRPGVFPWEPGRSEVISREGDPFRVVIRDFLPASSARMLHEPAADGVPMVKLGVFAQPPGSPRPMDIFAGDAADDQRWLVAGNEFGRIAREVGPARFVFQYADTPDLVDDFLHPPKDPSTQKLARLHYTDLDGRDRVYDWPIDGQVRSVLLPGSDLTATFYRTETFPDPNRSVGRDTGERTFPVVRFKVRRGETGPEVDQVGFSTLPGMARFIAEHVQGASRPLVRVGYFTPPLEGGRGTFGVVELLGTPEGRLFHRVFGRDGLRSIGPLDLGKDVRAFGGGTMPMTLTFRVDQYLKSGREQFTFVPAQIPANQMEQAIKAAQVEMTVDGVRKTFWARRTGEFEPDYSGPIRFGKAVYQVAYDVARKPLGFTMKLEDFQSDTDPGSRERSSYVSKVRLTDPREGIDEKPITISMNEPMTHRGYTFYQSNFAPLEGPDGQPTGQFRSVFQVHYDPAWPVVYSGCLLVVLGTFVQFYMRAGIFTDGGRRERARAEARARRLAGDAGMPRPEETDLEPL